MNSRRYEARRPPSARMVAYFARLVLCTLCCLTLPVQSWATPRMQRLTLIVPAAAGGGWDLTAKAMQITLERQGLVRHVSVVLYPGAGGLIGLSQFVSRYRGRDDVLLVGGLVMLGAAIRDEAAVTIRDVTPIARLTSEWELLATPAASPFRTVEDVRAKLRRDPSAVRWIGGAIGGPDQGMVLTVAKALDVPLDDVTYYGRAGGRRAVDALLQGRADIAVSGYAEFAQGLANGELRVLAVGGPQRIMGVAAPTLREAGVDATTMNWRAVFAAPGIGAAQQDRLTAVIDAMAHSSTWARVLRDNRWGDAYLDGNVLLQFLDREQARWADVITPPKRSHQLLIAGTTIEIGWGRLVALIVSLFVLVSTAGSLMWRLHRRRTAALALQRRCEDLALKLEQTSEAASKRIKDGIDGDFGEWKLSNAESDIAWFMLRGLPMREIADLRGTSERTVRQQAQAIYRKAGLDGRSDLAGRVLERFI